MKPLVENEDFTKARDYVFTLLKFRNRSEQEIREKLKKKKCAQKTIEKIIQYLEDVHFIDDRQFARDWIKARLTKPFGLRRISFELSQKGISKDIIKEELTAAKGNFPEEEIVVSLTKKITLKNKGLDKVKLKQKVFGFLSRRGFSLEAIQKVVNQI